MNKRERQEREEYNKNTQITNHTTLSNALNKNRKTSLNNSQTESLMTPSDKEKIKYVKKNHELNLDYTKSLRK